MRNTILFSAAFAALASALPSEYADVCPAFNNSKAAVTDGLVEVQCGRYPEKWGDDPLLGIEDIRACAEACVQDENCKGTVWSDLLKQCWTTDHDDIATKPWPQYVYMKKEQLPPPVPPTPQPDPQAERHARYVEKLSRARIVTGKKPVQSHYYASRPIAGYNSIQNACVDMCAKDEKCGHVWMEGHGAHKCHLSTARLSSNQVVPARPGDYSVFFW